MGLQNIHLPEQTLQKLSRRGLSRTKLLPNGALSDIELPRRVLTTGAGPTEAHHQDGALPKINCCRNGLDIQLP